MMKYKKNLPYVIIIGLVIAVIVSFAKIESLRTDIALLQNSQSNDAHRLEQQISSIYDNVDEQLKKQASLFSGVKHEFGEFDADAKMVNVKISVVPKTITANMVVNISAGDKTVKMEKAENGEYQAYVSVGLFDEYDTFPLLTIVSNGETKTEYIENIGLSYLWPNYLPTMEMGEILSDYATYIEEPSAADNTLTVKGNLELSYSRAEKYPDAVFEKIYVTAEKDGAEIARKDVTDAIGLSEDGRVGSFSVPFREIYQVGESDSLTLYIVAEDSLGYIHKKTAYDWTRSDEEGPRREPVYAGRYGGEYIYDKAGNLLYGKEF